MKIRKAISKLILALSLATSSVKTKEAVGLESDGPFGGVRVTYDFKDKTLEKGASDMDRNSIKIHSDPDASMYDGIGGLNFGRYSDPFDGAYNLGK